MKTLRYALLMLALAAPATLLAQMGGPAESPEGRGGQRGRRGMPSVDDQVKHLTKELTLTDSQQTQVKTILQDQHDQMQKMMQDSSGSREDNFSKMREIHQQSSAKIRDLLTDEQKTKYDKLQEERRQRWQERRPGND
jgi:protein CpxP